MNWPSDCCRHPGVRTITASLCEGVWSLSVPKAPSPLTVLKALWLLAHGEVDASVAVAQLRLEASLLDRDILPVVDELIELGARIAPARGGAMVGLTPAGAEAFNRGSLAVPITLCNHS
jgi:hypothetical protein